MRILIVDDEPPARDRLKRLIEELDGCECAGEAANGTEAISLVSRLAPDVVLLDIRMPGMDGVEAAQHLSRLEEPPAVIFVTAYDEYALRAFDAQAVGYLLKPVRKEKLADTLQRAARLTRPQLMALARHAAPAQRRTHLSVRLRGELRLIPLEEVLYFLADQKYVTVRHIGGQELIEESLRSLEEEFAPDFVRIHRNSLVAARHIASIERSGDGQYAVRLRGHDGELPVSRRLATEVLRRFRG
ncbi:MAG TPA: LytTR family DNA-binding domain-containing protein [Steroidobacteraceae bacterium]|nr:LytTR family DNA-binding domain-containing protein [Steroidobacteraceae bacterium]